VETGGHFAYRIKLMADQTKEMFGRSPDDLGDFALASQISQAEAKKFFVEMFRMRKWRKTGIIWWNVIDCWPQFSDAVVDYYFAKKLAYWYIKRVQTPLCVMLDEPTDWHCRIVATNDTLRPQSANCRITDAETENEVYAEEFHVDANGVREIGKIRVSHGEHRVFIIKWETDGVRQGNHYLLGKPPFDLAWYRRMLTEIASLPCRFDAERVAK
jgi:beta-mannosidase